MPTSTNRVILLLSILALALAACGSPTPGPEEVSPLPTPGANAIQVPAEAAEVTLPLHMLARVGQPGQAVTVTLRWEDGTELSGTYVLLQDPDGGGLLVDSLDWQAEIQPPQPQTQPAILTLATDSGEVLAKRALIVLSPDDPDTQVVDLYWTVGEGLDSEQRAIIPAGEPAAVTLEELLWGPPPDNPAGFGTALPTPDEVLAYPGRGADWGVRVTLLGLTIENGVATADFSPEMQAYGGGSTRVQTIREQITRTLMQFDGIKEVRIAIAGQTEGVLQP